MGQIWEVINIDRTERGLAGGRKLVEFFFWQQRHMESLYVALQTPCLPDAVEEWLSRSGVGVRQPGSIGKLSTELLDMIFRAILEDATTDAFTTNLLSCICFALGCKRLLTVGKRRIADALFEHHAPAAGCRLICLGEATDATDQAPAGMLTRRELKEIAATKVAAEDDKWAIARRNEDGADPSVILERCLYEFAMESYADAGKACAWRDRSLFGKREALWKGPDHDSYPYLDLGEPEHHEPPRKRRDPLQDLDRKMVKALTSNCPTYPAGPNVLLNVTRGEYVREAALTEFGNDPNRVTLVHAMLSRICYSQDTSVADGLCGDEFVGKFGRGPWAGCRFHIMSESDMLAPQVCGFAKWTDVTEEVNRLLGNLWRAMDCEEELARIAQTDKSRHAVYVAEFDWDRVLRAWSS